MGNIFHITVDQDLEEIVPGYLQSRSEEIKILKQLIIDKDYNKISLIGHTLKGTGGGYGFWELTNIGSALEIAGKEGNTECVQNLIKRLEEFLNNIVVTYL